MNVKPHLVSSNNGLVVKNLRKSLSRKQIVRDVSLKLQRGKTIGLLGPNGAGKTTTFYMIMGLINNDGGEIFLDDKNLTALPMYKRSRLGLGFLPQQPSIFRGMSVEDNLLAVLETKNYSKDNKQNILEELLIEFSLSHLRRAMPHMLSGGERRRTEIARCLCSNPSIILMDEPTAGVDPIGIDDIKILIRQLMKKNIGVLITDHNVREVLDICDYSYVMHAGEIIAEGESDRILGNKEVRKFYLGDSFKF
jgi:lipopolysaccharide export system ATP-binding protein